MNPKYDRQVSLLIKVIPFLAKRNCFALHGGTAINLFLQEMPRLSVDIDLTYRYNGSREEALDEIQYELTEVASELKTAMPGLNVLGPQNTPGESKLYCSSDGVQIKVEVNTMMRGLIEESQLYRLCQTAEGRYGQFCEANIVGLSQLYGGKICAALDRQHPRDLYDLDQLMEKDQDLMVYKHGILYALLSSKRPLHELLDPRFEDQRLAYENQFVGMTRLPFSYEQYDKARIRLHGIIRGGLTMDDMQFLLDFTQGKHPISFQELLEFPSVRWKMQNLDQLRIQNKEKYNAQLRKLERILDAKER